MQNIHKIFTFFSNRGNLSMILFVFIAIAISWTTINQIEYNYTLEQQERKSEEEVAVLRQKKVNQELQNQFYQTDYYRELAVRDELGLVSEGEKVVFIDKDRVDARIERFQATNPSLRDEEPESLGEPSALEQWARFFTGKTPL